MTDERDYAIQAYSKIAEQIEKEDGLVNQRLTWGASINGALLTLLGVGGGLFKDFLKDPSIYVTIFVCVIAVFLSIIAVLVCRWTIEGIVDARKQINYIEGIYKDKWKPRIKNLNLDLDYLPRPFGEVPSRAWFLRWPPSDIGPWWGDQIFRLMIVLWVFVIIVCVVAAAYHIAVKACG
jgi:hypothetical protein